MINIKVIHKPAATNEALKSKSQALNAFLRSTAASAALQAISFFKEDRRKKGSVRSKEISIDVPDAIKQRTGVPIVKLVLDTNNDAQLGATGWFSEDDRSVTLVIKRSYLYRISKNANNMIEKTKIICYGILKHEFTHAVEFKDFGSDRMPYTKDGRTADDVHVEPTPNMRSPEDADDRLSALSVQFLDIIRHPEKFFGSLDDINEDMLMRLFSVHELNAYAESVRANAVERFKRSSQPFKKVFQSCFKSYFEFLVLSNIFVFKPETQERIQQAATLKKMLLAYFKIYLKKKYGIIA